MLVKRRGVNPVIHRLIVPFRTNDICLVSPNCLHRFFYDSVEVIDESLQQFF